MDTATLDTKTSLETRSEAVQTQQRPHKPRPLVATTVATQTDPPEPTHRSKAGRGSVPGHSYPSWAQPPLPGQADKASALAMLAGEGFLQVKDQHRHSSAPVSTELAREPTEGHDLGRIISAEL